MHIGNDRIGKHVRDISRNALASPDPGRAADSPPGGRLRDQRFQIGVFDSDQARAVVFQVEVGAHIGHLTFRGVRIRPFCVPVRPEERLGHHRGVARSVGDISEADGRVVPNQAVTGITQIVIRPGSRSGADDVAGSRRLPFSVLEIEIAGKAWGSRVAGTEECFDYRRRGRRLDGIDDRTISAAEHQVLLEVDHVGGRALFQERQQSRMHGETRVLLRPVTGDGAVGGRIVLQRQTELLQVIATARAARRFARRLNRRKQHRNEDADNGNHYQQFDQGKTGTGAKPGSVTFGRNRSSSVRCVASIASDHL